MPVSEYTEPETGMKLTKDVTLYKLSTSGTSNVNFQKNDEYFMNINTYIHRNVFIIPHIIFMIINEHKHIL